MRPRKMPAAPSPDKHIKKALYDDLGRAGLAGQQAWVDPRSLERCAPALVGRSLEQDPRAARGGEPGVTGHFLVELAFAPAGIAERGDPLRRASPLGDGAEHVDRSG